MTYILSETVHLEISSVLNDVPNNCVFRGANGGGTAICRGARSIRACLARLLAQIFYFSLYLVSFICRN